MKSAVCVILALLLAAVSLAADNKTTVKSEKDVIPPDTVFVKCDSQPEMIKEVAPVYPEQAKKNKIEAALWVKAYVDATGAVKKAMVTKCDKPGLGFEDSALKAAYLNKYKPAKQGSKPVGVWITYPVHYKLK